MNGPKVLFSHPGCPPFAQQAARSLYEADLLSKYVTTFSYQSEALLGKALRRTLGLVTNHPELQLARRQITEVPESVVVHHSLSELLRTVASKAPSGQIL